MPSQNGGAHSILVSRNMTSVTDGGDVGQTDMLWATDFSGANYALTGMAEFVGNADIGIIGHGSVVAGGCTLFSYLHDNTKTDIDTAMVAGFGDQ